MTDSRGELIAFCPVRGKNPGGVSFNSCGYKGGANDRNATESFEYGPFAGRQYTFEEKYKILK